MTSTRRNALLVAAGAFCLAAFSSMQLAGRIVAFHRQNPRAYFAFEPLHTREFRFAGRDVTITDSKEGDTEYVTVRYGETPLKLRATIPGKYDLPGLAKHADWLKVLRFADSTGMHFETLQRELEEGRAEDRLVIVTKSPMPGSDPATWGEVWRNDWDFDFHELKPEGGFSHQRLAYPMSERRRKSLGLKEPRPNELAANTWQYQAALYLMPKGPSIEVRNSALMATGWWLPIAGFAGAVVMGALVIAVAPIKRGAKD